MKAHSGGLVSNQQGVADAYRSMYGGKPLVVRSPGRINLIGEHTDYNGGFVMPAAINYETVFAIGPSPDETCEIYSVRYGDTARVDLADVRRVTQPAWANFLFGVLRQFLDDGHTIRPFRCAFGGDVPLGAGLSSSASIECGFALALSELNGLDVPRQRMIHMAQWSEHNYVGVKSGIMDQFASMMGKKDHVIVLDCRSLEYHYFPLRLRDHDIVLCDTQVKHSLVDSEYNVRRSECEQGVALLQSHYKGVTSLRDADEEMVRRHRTEMPGKVFDRCLYVVQEIRRVQEASRDLAANRLEAFGARMYETHDGLSRLYEVSCGELDFLVDFAKNFGSIAGSRMMGGGFGGCTINLVPKGNVQSFIRGASEAYVKRFGHEMAAYLVSIEDGTSVVEQV